MLELLRLELKSRIRATIFTRELIILLVLGLIGLYFIANALVLGFLLDDIAIELIPTENVWTTVNRGLFYYLLIDVLIRFWFQSFPITDIATYLLLPIPRRRIYHFVLLRSIPNFFNLLPCCLFLPYAFSYLAEAYSASTVAAFLILLSGIVLTNHFLAFFLKRNFNVKPLYTFLLLLAAGLLFYLDVQTKGMVSIPFAQLIDPIRSMLLLAFIPLLLAALVYLLLLNRFQHYSYLDALVSGESSSFGNEQSFSFLEKYGRIGELIRLDLRLILRNKRPRTMLLIGAIFIMYPLLMDSLLENTVATVFIGSLVTAYMALQYGQFTMAWESSFFDLLIGSPVSMREWYQAKYYLFSIMILLTLALCSAYALIEPAVLPIFIACALFNIGVLNWGLLFLSTRNGRKIDADRSAFFNYEGVNLNQFIVVVPAMFSATLLFAGLEVILGTVAALTVLGSIGLIGIIFRERMIDLITDEFMRRKYHLSASFKK